MQNIAATFAHQHALNADLGHEPAAKDSIRVRIDRALASLPEVATYPIPAIPHAAAQANPGSGGTFAVEDHVVLRRAPLSTGIDETNLPDRVMMMYCIQRQGGSTVDSTYFEIHMQYDLAVFWDRCLTYAETTKMLGAGERAQIRKFSIFILGRERFVTPMSANAWQECKKILATEADILRYQGSPTLPRMTVSLLVGV